MFRYFCSFLWTFFLFLPFVQCLRPDANQFEMGEWVGVSLETGEEVRFSEFPEEVLALNVYGLNCVPCWKEIPALNRIQERLSKDPRFGIVMIVDPVFLLENSGTEPKDSSGGKPSSGIRDPVLPVSPEWEKCRAILLQEKKLRNIRLPIYIMKPPFRIASDSLVTGTPETLLVRTRPWRIYYNFLGSLSEKTTVEEIDQDPRVRFFLNKMGARGL